MGCQFSVTIHYLNNVTQVWMPGDLVYKDTSISECGLVVISLTVLFDLPSSHSSYFISLDPLTLVLTAVINVAII